MEDGCGHMPPAEREPGGQLGQLLETYWSSMEEDREILCSQMVA